MSSNPHWQLHLLDAQQGLGMHRQAWDRLNHELFGEHAMFDGTFVDALLRHFGTSGARLAIARRGDAPVAMLLLNTHPRGLGVWSSFLPSQTQIGPSLLPPGLDIGGLLAALPGYASELDLLCNDPRFGDLRQLPCRPVKSVPHALTMNISLAGSFDDYWAMRPRKLIQNMRRYLRRLQSEPGAERLVVISAPEAMAAAVQRYAALESSGWKGREGTAISDDNPQGRFYVEVMQQFAARGEALVYELWLGEDLLASRMLLFRGSMVIMLKTAFDEQFDRLAPGRILLLRTLEDLFTRVPGGVVEFYTNADSDLLAWSTSQRWINHVSVYRHGGLPALYGLLRRGKRGWHRKPQDVDANAMAERSGATVECFNHPRELPADAIALLQRSEQAYVEFGADWLGLLSDTVFRGEISQAALYVLRRQGRTLAVLPIGSQPGASGPEVGALANYYTTLYSPAMAQDLTSEDLLPLMLALKQGHRGTPAYRFWPMDPEAREFRLLRDALRLAGLRPHEYFAFGNWYLQVDCDWAGYLKNRSGQLRSTIKRMTKRLAAEDNGRLEIIRGEADVERGIAAYEAVYGASWKVPEPYVEFIPGLIRLCARRGWLRLGVAWIGDKPIAAQLWIVNAGRAHIYKVAYDEAFKAMAPGTLVTALLLEEVIDRDKVTEVDYLIGDDAYKKTWMSHRRERFGLIAYDPATPRGLYGLLRQAVGNAWRRLRALRTSPALPADNPAS
jgi:CelD/BcsL family acetyltransferase involved in cellulose biosynthesis